MHLDLHGYFHTTGEKYHSLAVTTQQRQTKDVETRRQVGFGIVSADSISLLAWFYHPQCVELEFWEGFGLVTRPSANQRTREGRGRGHTFQASMEFTPSNRMHVSNVNRVCTSLLETFLNLAIPDPVYE